MSWIDDLQKIFSITTGDGVVYYPLLKQENTKDVDYNTSLFEFVNVSGTLVIRKKPKGRKFDLAFYFTGENATDLGNSFERSAANSNTWTVEHPKYGRIICQPLALKQDDSFLNCSGFTCQVVETQTTDYPKSNDSITDIIRDKKRIIDSATQDLFCANEITAVQVTESTSKIDSAMSVYMKTSDDVSGFKTLVNKQVNLLQSTTSTPLQIITQLQNIINFPIEVNNSVLNRLQMLASAYTSLDDTIAIIGASGRTKEQKVLYENNATTILSAMCLAAVTGTYILRKDVITAQEIVSDVYDNILTRFEENQTLRPDTTESYFPLPDNMNYIDYVYNLTMSGIWDMLNSAKQEREHICEQDTNPVILTHRFLGMDDDDENLNTFISINNIGINELLLIQKGRKVIYYV